MTRKRWRCFHCDEVFTSVHRAKIHFGYDNNSTPACFILGAAGSLIETLREAEKQVDDAWFAIHNEALDCHKAMHAMSSRHQTQLRAAEELGYERGLRDAKVDIEENRVFRNALEFYASESNWTEPGQVNSQELFDTAMGADLGSLARAALSKES